MSNGIYNYHGTWRIRVDGEETSRFKCPYLSGYHCEHPSNSERILYGMGIFGYENCVYQYCPIHVRESFEEL